MDSQRNTALYAEHKALGARIVEFGGWQMPVSYSSVLEEHTAVRERAGIFDVSHMGEIFVTGAKAKEFLQQLTINNVDVLEPWRGQYNAICNEDGGMIDDLFLYRLEGETYLLCVNAANIAKDLAWIEKNAASWSDLKIENQSDAWSQVAVQGPNSYEALAPILPEESRGELADLPYTHVLETTLFGEKALVARTGYTGEKGYEIYMPNSIAASVWRGVLATAETANGKTGVVPVGLGARDTLRLEACYLLYGNDMNEGVSPLEAGIGWATKLDKGPFLGSDALAAQKAEGPKRRIYAFIMEDKGIARHDMKVYREGEEIGVVTSGSVLPSVGGAGGMMLLAKGKVSLEDSVEIDIRGKRKVAKIVRRPLYSAKAKG